MINHARALLANVSAADRPRPGTYGEEYTPPGFSAGVDAPALARVRSALLGYDPDALYLNSRLRLVLAAAHATPSVDRYFRSLDPRLTYLGDDEPSAADVAVKITTTAPMQLNLFGSAAANDVEGLSVFGYRITVGADYYTVADRVRGANRRFDPAEQPPTLSCGLRLGFMGAWTPGVWDVLVIVPSRFGLAELYAALRRSDASIATLLAGTSVRWRELWTRGIGVAAKMAGLAAAVVEATETARHA